MNEDNLPFPLQVRKRVERIVRYLSFNKFTNGALIQGQELILQELIALGNLLDEQKGLYSAKRQEEVDIVSHIGDNNQITNEMKSIIKVIQEEALFIKDSKEHIINAKWLFRYIGDGIAWRAYSNDHSLITHSIIGLLGAKEVVSFSSKKEGFSKEIELFRRISQKSHYWLPILHDITNCLRTADISIFYNGSLITLAEIKIKNGKVILLQEADHTLSNDPRIKRQISWLKKGKDFLSTGDLGILRSEWAGGKSIKQKKQLHYHYYSMSTAIHESRLHGIGYHEPEKGFLIFAINKSIGNLESAIGCLQKQSPKIFETRCIVTRIGPSSTYHHDLIPVTAMDIPSRDILSILFDDVQLYSLINYSCLVDHFKERDIELRIENDEDKQTHLFVKDNDFNGEICERLWNRVTSEGLAISSLIDLVKGIKDNFITAQPANRADLAFG